MKHLELFAGIGGFRRATDLLASDGIMNFESMILKLEILFHLQKIKTISSHFLILIF